MTEPMDYYVMHYVPVYPETSLEDITFRSLSVIVCSELISIHQKPL